MNKPLLIFLFFCLISSKMDAQLTINISNIKEIKGDMHIGIYNDPEVFLSLTEQYIFKLIKVDSYTMILTLDSVPVGYYAISIMQDLNSSGEMDKNFFGIPKEPYGFSQNINPRFSAPKFEESQFYYDGKYLEVKIILLD